MVGLIMILKSDTITGQNNQSASNGEQMTNNMCIDENIKSIYKKVTK